MNNKCVASAIFVVLVAQTLTLSADLPDRWRAWRYSRPVAPHPVQTGGPAEIVLPWEIFPHCSAGCGDVRLISAQGQEVPFELEAVSVATRAESYAARIVEDSFVAGQYTQIVGDLGQRHPFYQSVRVETNESDFIAWAEVALSDDAKSWRVVEPRAPIARFRNRSVDGTRTIPFHGLNARYIRVRILKGAEQFSADGLTVFHDEVHPPERTQVPATFAAVNTGDSTESVWTADLASAHIPVSQLRFATGSPEFYRAVRISSSTDGKEWSNYGSGFIYRYRQGDKVRESLSIDFAEWPENHFLRIEVLNGSDAPLSDVGLSLWAVPRKVLFRAHIAESYTLLYGNERAAAPQYDLSHYLEAGPGKPIYVLLSVGPEEVTANYQDPRPFTERHPEVLWVALGIAVVLIGLTAVKTLRSADAGLPKQTNDREV